MVSVSIQAQVHALMLCNCCTFLLSILTLTSPLWIWAWGYAFFPSSWGYTSVIVAMGWKQAGVINGRTPAAYLSYYVAQQKNPWKTIPDSVCVPSTVSFTPPYFDPYVWTQQENFCSSSNKFQIPRTVQVLKIMCILVTVAALCAALASFFVRWQGRYAVTLATFSTLLVFVFSTVAWSIFTAFDYAANLRSSNGSYLPVLLTGNSSTDFDGSWAALKVKDLGYGPAYGCMLLIWFFSFFSSILLVLAFVQMKREEVENYDYEQDEDTVDQVSGLHTSAADSDSKNHKSDPKFGEMESI